MNNNASRTLWISIGAALFAIFLLYSYSQEKKAEYDSRLGTLKQVVVAKKDILEMSTIDDTMIETVSKPIDFVEPGAIENPEEVIGLVAAAPIKEKEQLLNTKVLKPGTNTGLSMQVAPNKRAITIPVDEVRGVAKLIRPGDRIDILAAVDSGSGPNRRTSVKTIMQDVYVLATGVNVTNNIPRTVEVTTSNKVNIRNLNGDTTFSTITLELSPEESQSMILLQAANPGSIYITLRNPNDRAKKQLPNADLSAYQMPDPSMFQQQPRLPSSPPEKVSAPVKKVNGKRSPWIDIN
ncbi:MAG: Flp pilus assembly protein CpaB [Bdellovibrionales bacterium]|nr:Flp pilus assembly protein CpaB [Bdellovibrionales bacterium]